ncbi:MAG: heavy-metal-associated domain-containing protein [Eubacterium sp.]|jgi:copper chaperone CopZ|nr:heavy-metal-associated domain-containing protein [Eubacterium sp.]MCH4046235.1 heavy-metal-associated domain-containing protein [Eubacterium sp.]MCH4079330.1 heavy-metal-associated domain-containing protein [Eubacterium sp.]MCH4110554.1 heavy-metal-associated domain-containing protein [Eubacterium sp.]MCI1307718.1 heavy-metal-associated domain-containing protein [Eubacterium sp.]
MNFGVIVVIAVIALILVFAIRKSIKTVKGGCCGGGGGDLKPLKKELDGRIVSEKIMHIDGMHCKNCQYRVQRALDRIDGVSSDVSFKKNQAVVKMDREVSDERLSSAVTNTGYEVSGIEAVPVA